MKISYRLFTYSAPLLLICGLFSLSVRAADEYLVIDVSSGQAGSNYPVTYYDEADLPGAVTDDAYKTDKILLKKVISGTFMMGSPTNEVGRPAIDPNEDLHQVTLTRDFYLGVYEFTEYQWFKLKGDSGTEKYPVYAKNYDVIIPALGELNNKTDLGELSASLPTEAQWEYACHAGTQTSYSFGSDAALLGTYAWYEVNSGVSPWLFEKAVGTRQPNPWGFYDMHGSVLEYCKDTYISNLGTNAVTDPYRKDGVGRVAKGGGAWSPAADCRSAYRFAVVGYNPEIGFRISVALPPPPPTYDLTVVSGSGSGSYTNGHVQQIIADAPPAWYEFDLWTGNIGTVADVSAPTTTVTIGSSALTVEATYKPRTFAISISNGTASAYTATNGQVVTVIADPPATETNVFYRWEGDVATVADISAMTTTVIIAGADLNLTAIYRDAPYYLTVNNGTGDGYHFEGEVVTISAAAPAAQKTFWWDGDNTSVADPEAWNTTLIMPDADIEITATYPDIKYTLTVINGYGSGSYVNGTEVNVSPVAAPSSLHEFDQWAGDTPGLQSFLTASTVFTINGSDALIEPHYKPVAAVQGDYMVVDLTSNPYETTYMDAPPAGGWDNDYTEDLMAFRRVLPGFYQMGSGTVAAEDEHTVTLTEGFYVGIFEVTQGQWRNVKGSYPPAGYTGSNRAFHPAENISYDDIRGAYNSGYNWPSDDNVGTNSFFGILRRKTGSDGFNLPTEAQWEYACRAGSSSDFYGDPLDIAVYSVNSEGETAEVGTKDPNAWGLYDTLGNVYEWTLDWFHGNGLGTAPQTDPVGPVDPLTSGFSNNNYTRVVRGGAYDSNYDGVKTAFRAAEIVGRSSTNTGFRVVKNVGVPHTLTVVNGKINSGGIFYYRAIIAISAEEPENENQIFDGWKVEPEGAFAGPLFDASSRDTIISMPSQDITVTAQYN